MDRNVRGALLLSFLGPAVLVGCAKEHTLYTVAKLPSDVSGGVLTYYLPKTEVTVQVTEKTVSYSGGKFYPVAHWLRGTSPLPTDLCAVQTVAFLAGFDDGSAAKAACPKARPTQGDKASVTGVTIESSTLVDSEHAFAISIPDAKLLSKTGVSFEFTSTGLTTGGTATNENKTVETIVASLKATASVVGAALGVSGEKSAVAAVAADSKKDSVSDGESKKLLDAVPDKAESLKGKSGLSLKDMLSKIPKDPCLLSLSHPNAVEVLKAKNFSAHEVCESFYRLGEVKKKRDALLNDPSKSGDGGSFSAALKSLEEERDQLLGLFEAKKTETTRTFSVTIPENKVGAEVCVPRDAKKHLIPGVAVDCPSAAVAETDGLKAAPDVRLSLKVNGDNQVDSQCKPVSQGGLVYRLPASGKVLVGWDDGKMSSSARVTLPQFGRCIQAPNKVKGKKSKLVAKISKETGMLTTFEFEQNRDYSDQVEKAGEAIKDVAAAVKERADEKKAERKEELEKENAENDPVSQKKKELELLELQHKIDCLTETGKPCPEEKEEEKDEE